ncbi:MAG: response regulator [Myxococcales bacterium]|nr:response regulator [Myxococcales bacterium]
MSSQSLGQMSRRPRILCVDDEPNVLEGLMAFLRRRFRVFTALNGAAAMVVIEEQGPFEVVVSDMRMPGMDGAAFLAEVRNQAPDTTRILLTGHAEVPAAISAVNDGEIFRFLTKPCPPAVLQKAVMEGCRQYQLRLAEKQLLEETLKGSVSVLAEVMALASPEVFGRANRIQRTVRWVVFEMGLEDRWRFELAAMLSQIGLVGVDEDIVRRWMRGLPLDPHEQKAVEEHPDIARKMLSKIPRLEAVAQMVALQRRDVRLSTALRAMERNDHEQIGGHILRAALDLDAFVGDGLEALIALDTMSRTRDRYNPVVIEALLTVYQRNSRPTRSVGADQLDKGMVLLEPIRTIGGVVVVPKGHEITGPVRARLLRFAQGRGVREPILVQLPEPDDSTELESAAELIEMSRDEAELELEKVAGKAE